MAHLLEQVPVGRITEEAKQVRFGYTVLTIIAGLLYALGWVVAKTFTGIWFILAWVGTAVKVGWKDARTNGPAR